MNEVQTIGISTGRLPTGDMVKVVSIDPAAEAIVQPPVIQQALDLKNVVSVMVFIRDTFELNHQQMMDLRQRVEKTFHAQPQVFSKRAPAPVTLNGVAIAYGLLIGFGGYKAALKASSYPVLKIGREHDPFADADRSVQIAMHKRATARRMGRR